MSGDAFVCRLDGEVGKVLSRGEAEEVADRVAFHCPEFVLTSRPMQKECILLFGVSFRVKKITHGYGAPRPWVALHPATLNEEMMGHFLSDCTSHNFNTSELH